MKTFFVKLTSQLLHSMIHQVMWYFCVHSESIFQFMQYLVSQENCASFDHPCLLLIAELISPDTSGKPFVGSFLKITSPSWIILSISLDELNSIDCWRADDEFSWKKNYFIVVKEFWCGKKYYRIFGGHIWILLRMLTSLVIWKLNITVSTTLKYCYK